MTTFRPVTTPRRFLLKDIFRERKGTREGEEESRRSRETEDETERKREADLFDIAADAFDQENSSALLVSYI